MKKYLLVLACAVLMFAVTGCGKKNQVVCTQTQEESGITVTGKVVVDFDKDDKLTDATASYELSDKTAAEQYCTMFKLMENADKGVKIECSGKKITIKGFANMQSDDDDDEEIIGMSKSDFTKKMQEEGFTCK